MTVTANELVVVFDRLRRRMREIPSDSLTPSQTSLLVRLAKEGESSTSELAKAEGVRPQSMSALARALEGEGLITRRADPCDGRRQILSLSDRGRKRVELGRRLRYEWLSIRMRESLTDAELQHVSAALTLLSRVVDR